MMHQDEIFSNTCYRFQLCQIQMTERNISHNEHFTQLFCLHESERQKLRLERKPVGIRGAI